MQISATIITYNEQRNIARAIESLRCCDEVVVVDSGSVDRTVEIATKLGARVVEHPWEGFASQKNVAAQEAAHDWIFSIDADELLSEALEGEIWQLKKNGPQYDAYTMPRLARYLGRWIMHSGWHPDHKIRLYDRRKARWEGSYVHESVHSTGSVGHLKVKLNPPYLRFAYRTYGYHEPLHYLGRRTVSGRRSAYRLEAPAVGSAPWTFFQTYFLKRGFLDGTEGLAIAYMASLYNFVKYAKARFMHTSR